jgi:hypothetical protein
MGLGSAMRRWTCSRWLIPSGFYGYHEADDGGLKNSFDMKILKITATILGLIWMILYGIGSVLSIIQKPINLSTPDGIGMFLGALAAHIFIFSIGFFLFRWDKKPLTSTL